MEENQHNRIGLITYHAAYNFGSVLQAYATKIAIEKLGHTVDIIDYRTPSQTYWYTTEASRKLYGRRRWLWDMQFYLKRKSRLRRRKKFEDFISELLNPTRPLLRCYQEVKDAGFEYDILVCGSDQIWNSWCTEFSFEKEDAILPYFLKFGKAKRRVAFSSSFGTGNEVIDHGWVNLSGIDRLSVREETTAKRLEKLTGRQITHVCDPTLLLKADDWLIEGTYKPTIGEGTGYLFIYNLGWSPEKLRQWLPYIKKFAKKHDWPIVLVSPLHYSSDKEVKVLHDAGPLDFLSYMRYASFVITTTFHGTMFSLNFERPFISCSTAPDSRQGQVLCLSKLEDHIVNNPEELLDKADQMISTDFSTFRKEIDKIRERSIAYLKEALTL